MKLTDGEVDDLFEGTTFGMEYDCGMFDRRLVMDPELGTFCTDEVASHSNAGIGADPLLRYNLAGGEVQVAPADSEEQLLKRILQILDRYLITDDLQFPGTIHVHVRIPKLLEQPDLIRHLVRWSTRTWWDFAPEIYHWCIYGGSKYNTWLENCNADVKTMIYDQAALARMEMAPDDPAEIARALHNWPLNYDAWKNEWHVVTDKVKRPAVNFGHLAINETIEYRSFVTTTERGILGNMIAFPLRHLRAGLTGDDDPVRVMRGWRYQDRWVLPVNEFYGSTSLYFNTDIEQREAIAIALVSKKITVKDLNYPEFWIRKGFQ
ncbi:MAG: hypothetical protein ACR2PR_07540 [Pseudohongiellaceae bacterium]